jgi:hypothetical protein
MPLQYPYTVYGFHSCDQSVGLKVLNGKDTLLPSTNPWDWLGEGVYFWEQNPGRALEYATENAQQKQKNKVRIEEPFVLGAIIELGNCLNLAESASLSILREAYDSLKYIKELSKEQMLQNKGDNRALDCEVFKYLHHANKIQGKRPYDSIRCPFSEGHSVYPGTDITTRLHVQICVINPDCIKGYFLPRPVDMFNPQLL